MSPNEAAELLGVAPTAGADEVERAYAFRLAEAGGDPQRSDALAAARDALLAASPWRPPAGSGPTMGPTPPVVPAQHGYPAAPAQPVPGGWYAPPPPPTPNGRRPMSTGAIVGIALGGTAALLVVLLVAVFAVASVGASSRRIAEAARSADPAPHASPYDPPSGPSSEPPTDSSPTEDYDVDGVHVHYVDGWTFELTSAQSCSGATVTAGFADTPEGDTLGEWSTDVDLEAGVAVTLTIPDSASSYRYVGIDSVQCGQA